MDTYGGSLIACLGVLLAGMISGESRGAQSGSDAPAWQALVEQWEATEQAIGAMDFRLDLTRTPESPIARGRSVHFSQLGSLVRLTLDEERYQRNKQVWVHTRQDILNDGETEWALIADDVSALGVMTAETHGVNDCLVCQAPRNDQYFFVLPELLRRFGLPDGSILTLREVIDRSDQVSVEQSGAQSDAAGPVLRLEGKTVSAGAGETRWKIEVQLSAAHGMHPIAVRETIPGSDSLHSRERKATRFHQSGGVFFPLVVVGSASRGPNPSSMVPYANYLFVVREFQVNCEIDNARFGFEFPPNSIVYYTSQLRLTDEPKQIDRAEVVDERGQIARTFDDMAAYEAWLADRFAPAVGRQFTVAKPAPRPDLSGDRPGVATLPAVRRTSSGLWIAGSAFVLIVVLVWAGMAAVRSRRMRGRSG